MIDRRARQLLQPEILGGVQLEHLHMLLNLPDGGQEQRAVEPAFIEPPGLHIGGGDDHHAPCEEGLEQAPEDHGVGDVGHREFIEAKQPGLGGQSVGDLRHGLVALGGPRLAGEAPVVDALVHIGHEGLKMHPPLGLHRRRLEKEVHEHGLAAPHRPPEIDPARRLTLGLAAKEAAQNAGVAALLIIAQFARQPIKLRHHAQLRLVPFEGLFAEQGLIVIGNGAGHRTETP